MQIRDSAFLVTGGGSGLGAACARHLVGAGGNVLVLDIREEAGRQVADELGSKARFVSADVTNQREVQQAIDTAVHAWGSLAGAINCAGILGAARVVGKEGPHDLDLFSRVIQVNLIGTFNVVRLAAAQMALNVPNSDGERGVMICTASVAAFDGQIGQAAYAASKGGVASMMLPIARELARFGIRAVAIAPGVFETPMVSALPEAAQQSLAAQVPFPPRLGHPREYAALARHIIENPMLNGTTIRLDGALRMGAK
jgi:NAD(P)-dependent dehydrogenase (short-subunit alcohol dehydrogenase family)